MEAALFGLLGKLVVAAAPLLLSLWLGGSGARSEQTRKAAEVKDAQLAIAARRPGTIDAALGRL
jgi:hypothetical protein